MNRKITSAFNTGSSIVVTTCQTCDNPHLEMLLFLGYLPPVNTMPKIGSAPKEQPSYPAGLLYCPRCHLAQLSLIVDPKILFPAEYPYTSGTTRVLRDNFTELTEEVQKILNISAKDLVLDIGSNDGTLLSNFKPLCKVLGITPEDIGKIAIKNGIPTILDYFTKSVAKEVIKKYGKAKIVTAANVFAHIENVHDVLENILLLLSKDGVFISESHYFYSFLKTLQYDTIYHEHLRYYSLHSLQYLLSMHGLEIFHAKQIPTHGGSIRVYAARKGTHKVRSSVQKMLLMEKPVVMDKKHFNKFRREVTLSKLKLHKLFFDIKQKNQKIYGISAPSRATTLIHYAGLDDRILECVLEVKGSHKIGNYVPGTLIPVLDEEKLFTDQPEYALLLSWHIASELIPKLKEKGYKGKFIIPLPSPRIVTLK